MKIEYTKWGLANRFKDSIELNENLVDYPDLHSAILEHELGHTNNPSFNSLDLKHDLRPTKISQLTLLKFMIKHPKSFQQLLPVYYSKRHGIVYDSNLLFLYGVITIVIVLGIYIGYYL